MPIPKQLIKMKTTQEPFKSIPSVNSSENLISDAGSLNSFLIEVDHNHDISDSLRREINSRFIRSKANKSYKFPRVAQSIPLKLKPSIQKFALVRTQKKISINKRDISFSPYSMTLSRSKNSKSPNFGDNLSKTPLPDKSYFKLNKSTRLPILKKSKYCLKQLIKFPEGIQKR